MPLPFRALGVAFAVASMTHVAAADAPPSTSQPSGNPLGCAVENELEILRTGRVCEVLDAKLDREVVRIRDARVSTQGQALQILGSDVQWIVALLEDGRVRAWTRISKTYAEGKEIDTIARAARGLLAQKLEKHERCVRVEPNGGRKMRGFDLAYPWAELKQCTRRMSEVLDPWWDEER